MRASADVASVVFVSPDGAIMSRNALIGLRADLDCKSLDMDTRLLLTLSTAVRSGVMHP